MRWPIQVRRVVIFAVVSICIVILLPKHVYKAQQHYQHPISVVNDNLLVAAALPSDLPPIPKWNLPPDPHVPENTPLFIGFSQNWPMLQQAVVSYLVAGWPASDIYVVDNTGTMFSNQRKQLTIQNPSYLDYHRLEKIYQVNVISTPTSLSFSQLQNFYLHEALVHKWTYYFWSHMDVVVLSTFGKGTYQSLYLRAVQDMRSGLSHKDWATRFYAYDRLALVSVAAFDRVGGWDTSIPYYPSDCDMYERLNMAGYHNPSPDIGQIFDVATIIDDVSMLYKIGQPGSSSYELLYKNLTSWMEEKFQGGDRNIWQTAQKGGQSEPYYYDSKGWEISRKELIAVGRKLFGLKWGTKDCRLFEHGVQGDAAWNHSRSWWLWN